MCLVPLNYLKTLFILSHSSLYESLTRVAIDDTNVHKYLLDLLLMNNITYTTFWNTFALYSSKKSDYSSPLIWNI